MEIKYDIYTLSNVAGEGKERKFIKLIQREPKDENSLAKSIESGCTLTKSDIKAMFAALHDYAVHELSEGHRIYVPELGYFSLSVELERDEFNPKKKIRGQDIRLRGINFLPEKKLVQEVAQNVSFVRSRYSSQSTKYTEKEMWQKISDYLDTQRFITNRVMQIQFGLTKYTTHKWLTFFVEKDMLVKSGTNHAPIYYKK